MAAKGAGALAAAKAIELAAKLGEAFIPHVVSFAVKAFDKVGFDLDVIGRERQTKWMEEQARVTFSPSTVNIAIWNMHLAEDHHFNDIIFTGLQKMGNGGGFRIVVFLGSGYLVNKGDRGFANWICSGNQEQDGNRITFKPVPPLQDPAPAPPILSTPPPHRPSVPNDRPSGGERYFILAAGDNPYALCEREFGDGMKYLELEYNGQRLTEQSARYLPDGARLVYRGDSGGGNRGVHHRPAPQASHAGGGRRFILAAGDNPYALCEREFGDGMKYLQLEYNSQRLTEQSARYLPDGALLVYRG